jgi:AraC-like DNA-binding protein
MEVYWSAKSGDRDICVRQCGSEVCAKGHQYGPSVRDHYLIHYVASGKGCFLSESGKYSIGPKQGFIIFPDQITTYRADDENPWVYGWIGYEGRGAAILTETVGLTRQSPVFTLDAQSDPLERIRRMTRIQSEMRLSEIAMLGGLYQLLSEIGQTIASPSEDLDSHYCKKAVWYIEGNYHRNIRITDAAAFVGLSRSQLFRVFQRVMGVSPKEHLSSLRIAQASRLLKATNLSLEEIAASSGFSSVGRLNAVFRERFNASPGQYRKAAKGETKGEKALARQLLSAGAKPAAPKKGG